MFLYEKLSVPYQRQSIPAVEVIKNLLFSFRLRYLVCASVFIKFSPPESKNL
jgi:hypothetical protein